MGHQVDGQIGGNHPVEISFSSMPLSNPLPIQTSLDNVLQQGQGDKEAESHAHDADPPGVNPAVKGGSGDFAAGAPAEHAPSMRGSEHGQGGTLGFGNPPHRG